MFSNELYFIFSTPVYACGTFFHKWTWRSFKNTKQGGTFPIFVLSTFLSNPRPQMRSEMLFLLRYKLRWSNKMQVVLSHKMLQVTKPL